MMLKITLFEKTSDVSDILSLRDCINFIICNTDPLSHQPQRSLKNAVQQLGLALRNLCCGAKPKATL